MGKASKALRDFIKDIPDSKLEGFPESITKLYADQNFCLDMQGKTTTGKYNLQIQVNRETKISTLQPFDSKTVAGPVLAKGTESASEIRANLIAKMRM
ncbi:hypothetical protein HOY80DRAFT_1053444 [Tuber brumale]|nr:hypothetical protein HOY80DRAFT_1053444 [Tuber brumale]